MSGQAVGDHAERRPAVERVRVVPALDERAQQVADDGAAQLEGRVVPGGAVAVAVVHRLLLRVAAVLGVVAPAVAEVDATDERDVPLAVALVPDDEQLLVVRPEPVDALVEQHLARRRR